MKKNYQVKVYQRVAGRNERETGIITAISTKEAYEKAISLVSHKALFIKIIIKRV